MERCPACQQEMYITGEGETLPKHYLVCPNGHCWRMKGWKTVALDASDLEPLVQLLKHTETDRLKTAQAELLNELETLVDFNMDFSRLDARDALNRALQEIRLQKGIE